MIPRLDPKEVAAVFTAPFAQFLQNEWTRSEPGPVNSKGARHSWYRGTWTDWHESRWRMHNFYIPKPPRSASTLRRIPSHAQTSSTSTSQAQPEGDDPRPEPSAFEDLQNFRVFGMTARILVDAARVAYGTEPEFEHNSHFGDEKMLERLLKVGRLSEVRRKGEELNREVLMVAMRGVSKM